MQLKLSQRLAQPLISDWYRMRNAKAAEAVAETGSVPNVGTATQEER